MPSKFARKVANSQHCSLDIFGMKAQEMRDNFEAENAESVYETLENMPDFWQSSELANDHMHTLSVLILSFVLYYANIINITEYN